MLPDQKQLIRWQGDLQLLWCGETLRYYVPCLSSWKTAAVSGDLQKRKNAKFSILWKRNKAPT